MQSNDVYRICSWSSEQNTLTTLPTLSTQLPAHALGTGGDGGGSHSNSCPDRHTVETNEKPGSKPPKHGRDPHVAELQYEKRKHRTLKSTETPGICRPLHRGRSELACRVSGCCERCDATRRRLWAARGCGRERERAPRNTSRRTHEMEMGKLIF